MKPHFFRGLLFLLVALLTAVPATGQPTADSTAKPYRVYRGDGTPAALDSIVAAMDTTDVVLIGEVHNDPTAHNLQAELLKWAVRRYGASEDSADRSVALSLEMFERDVQPVVNEYLRGLITERHFLRSSRPWTNYQSAYRPLVEFAKTHDLPVLAANAPRRYVNRVTREGPASLTDLSYPSQQWLPPLPYADPSPTYRRKWIEAMHAAMDADSTENPHQESNSDSTHHGAADEHAVYGSGSGPSHLLQAQALWDATMAYAVARHLMRHPNALVLHLAGKFHVSRGSGMPEHLARYRPGAHTLIVVIQPVERITAFEAEHHNELGDFIILTDDARLPEQSEAASF